VTPSYSTSWRDSSVAPAPAKSLPADVLYPIISLHAQLPVLLLTPLLPAVTPESNMCNMSFTPAPKPRLDW
jgi:hypothetical protein